MEIRNESLTYNFDFTELPNCMKITDPSKSGENEQSIKVSNGLLSDDQLSVLRLLSCRASFPATFFDQNRDILQRNVHKTIFRTFRSVLVE